MILLNPQFLLLIAVIFLLLFWVIPKSEKYAVSYSMPSGIRETGVSRMFRLFIFVFWTFTVICLVFSLSRPQIEEVKRERIKEARELFLVIDVSTSMGDEMDNSGNPDPNSGISNIKKILKNFIQKRRGDFIGVGAYSGWPGQTGGAGIIGLPSDELILVENRINTVRPKMFGTHTATGEGLIVGVFGLVAREMAELEKRGKMVFDISKIRDSLYEDGLGPYADFFVKSLRPPLKNKAIILFTDGYYNTGIEPILVFSLIKPLGIKVYFVGIRPTSLTGVTGEEGQRKKAIIVAKAKETGGDYFEGETYEEVEKIYGRINEIEKAKFVVEERAENKDVYFWPAIFGALSFILFLLLRHIWPKIS